MSIPESQLETWSHQGAIAQSASTYASIRRSLEDAASPYASKTFQIFLQGSYCNDTNIYSESDVDVVIRLDSVFYSDLESLSTPEKQAFDAAFADGTYSYAHYTADVVAQLQKTFGASVSIGMKAVVVEASGNRRRSDVIVAAQYRRYFQFRGLYDQKYVQGICFFSSDGVRIANYPRQHSDNLTAKHQATGSWLKPVARIAKNLRSRLEDDGYLTKGDTPSYYLEGLLYNVPNENFGGTFQDTLAKCFDWIVEADRSQFVCANEQFYLLRDGSNECWSPSKCEAFLTAAYNFWENW